MAGSFFGAPCGFGMRARLSIFIVHKIPAMKKVLLPFFLIYSCIVQAQTVRQTELSHFQMQSSAVIPEAGDALSNTNYHSNVYWFPVTVPSTVLTGLVANHVYPSPYIGLNNMRIPDANDEFNQKYNLEQYSFLPNESNPWKKPYWYRTTFTVPASDNGKHFELIFKGINYRAAVYVNGVQIADSTQMAGMFAEYSLDVSKVIRPGSENALAVKIYPLDFPGLPSNEQLKALDDFYPNGGPTGDIGKNVTMLCSVGWDWIPPVRDRNIGIWQPVYLRTTGQVTIVHPQVIADLPKLPDTTVANLTINLTLSNHNTAASKGKLTVNIKPETFEGSTVSFSRDISINASAESTVSLSPSMVKQLIISNPHLWWPSGYGKPNLYRVEIQYSDNSGLSDEATIVTGIRTVSSKSQMVDQFLRRDFYVNGKRVFLTGGAWVPDMMLNRDSTRWANELHLCQNANINLVRIWGGGVTPPDIFFNLCDRLGLMVWSDFWITGDTQGEFKGSPDWPLQGDVFIRNITSTIFRIRNHPSLLVWTGGNEGHARQELYDAMRNGVIQLDGTRPFIPCSSGFAKLPEGWKGAYPDNQLSGVYSGGPYQWRDPDDYYVRADRGRDWVFKDETGIPSQPPYNSLIKVVPDLVWDKQAPFPMNDSWGYHDACTGNGHYDFYYNDMVARFGKPVSMEDFSEKMQLMNAMGYQGIFEAAEHKLNDIGGVMLWKLNAAFPSVIWQVYDWYLQPNAGYYFMQRACETVHIQFNRNDSTVAVFNKAQHAVPGQLTASVDVYDLKGRRLIDQSKPVTLGATDVEELIPLTESLRQVKEAVILILNLKDNSGKTVSHNTYWLAPNRDFTALNSMSHATLSTKILKTEKSGNATIWTIEVSNSSNQVGFFTRAQILAGKDEILPTFWNDNYFTLAPGESTTITASIPDQELVNITPTLAISGWNSELQTVPLR